MFGNNKHLILVVCISFIVLEGDIVPINKLGLPGTGALNLLGFTHIATGFFSHFILCHVHL